MGKKLITKEVIDAGLSYEDYRNRLKERIANPDGDSYSEQMMGYTQLNDKRMDRLDQTVEIQKDLAQRLRDKSTPETWLVLTEGWCGDAAQNIPILAEAAGLAPSIQLKLIYRDEHPEIMDAFLTNGGKAIPKLIRLDEELNVIGTWGPRPAPAQQMIIDHKANPGSSMKEVYKRMQVWYRDDKTRTLQKELADML